MKTALITLLLFSACSSGTWQKAGSTQLSFNVDSYACDMDQRMVSHSFRPPQPYPPTPNAYGTAGVGLSSLGSNLSQFEFWSRCMESRGYAWHADK